jgi:hypothetical protein
MCKFYQAAAAVAAHGTFVPIAVEVYHFKIVTLFVIQQYQTVSTNAKLSVAQVFYKGGMLFGKKMMGPVINHYKIIAGALVFIEFNGH